MNLTNYLLHTSLYKAPPLTQAELNRLHYQLDKNGWRLNDMMKFYNGHNVISGGEDEDVLEVWTDIRKALNIAFAWLDTPVPHPSNNEPLLISRRGEKTENLHLRVTADQRHRIRAKAERAGMTVSRFILTAALKKMPPLDRLSAAQTYVALMRIGNNLRQAVRYLNTHLSADGDGFNYITEEFLEESARFRRAFGWDYALEQEEAEADGLC